MRRKYYTWSFFSTEPDPILYVSEWQKVWDFVLHYVETVVKEGISVLRCRMCFLASGHG